MLNIATVHFKIKIPLKVNLHMKMMRNKLVIQQDNTGVIQLESNWKRSSAKYARHINVHYFCLVNKLKDGNITIIYHPTK